MGQVTVTGLPPPTGTAVTVYGPLVPGAGDTFTSTLEGLVACTSTTGEPAAGVVTVWGGDAGVGALLGPVPVAVTSYVVPGASPVRVQSGVAQVTVMGEPPPTGTAVTV